MCQDIIIFRDFVDNYFCSSFNACFVLYRANCIELLIIDKPQILRSKRKKKTEREREREREREGGGREREREITYFNN